MPDKELDSLHVYEILFISETSRQVLGDEQAFYSMGNRAVFPGVKWPRRDVYQSPPFSTQVKHEWNYTLLPLYVFIAPKGTTSPVHDIANSSFFP